MTAHFSNFYNNHVDKASVLSTVHDLGRRPPLAISGGKSRAAFPMLHATDASAEWSSNDTMRLATFKTGTRIESIEIWHSNPGNQGAYQLGYFEVGQNHDGPALLTATGFADHHASVGFMTGFAAVAYTARDDMFNEAAHFDDFDRGRKIIELIRLEGTLPNVTEAELPEVDLVLEWAAPPNLAGPVDIMFKILFSGDN